MNVAEVKVTRTGGFGFRWHVEIHEPATTGDDIEFWGRCDSTVMPTRRGAIRWAKRTAKQWADRDRAIAAAETFRVEL